MPPPAAPAALDTRAAALDARAVAFAAGVAAVMAICYALASWRAARAEASAPPAPPRRPGPTFGR